jgi:fission 1 protein
LGLILLKEIYSEAPERRRECLYYLALGSYKLSKYSDAKKYNETLLKLEPHNAQALSLRDLINENVQKDGLIGMGIVGGVVVGAGLLISALLSKKK